MTSGFLTAQRPAVARERAQRRGVCATRRSSASTRPAPGCRRSDRRLVASSAVTTSRRCAGGSPRGAPLARRRRDLCPLAPSRQWSDGVGPGTVGPARQRVACQCARRVTRRLSLSRRPSGSLMRPRFVASARFLDEMKTTTTAMTTTEHAEAHPTGVALDGVERGAGEVTEQCVRDAPEQCPRRVGDEETPVGHGDSCRRVPVSLRARTR